MSTLLFVGAQNREKDKMASDHEDEDNSEEHEEHFCDECFQYIDDVEFEENDGVCWTCAKAIEVDSLVRRLRLPSNYEAKEVSGNHRKPCSDCGKCNWELGDWYVYDKVNPWGTDKFCLECAESRDWEEEDGEDDECFEPYLNLHQGLLPVIGGMSSAMRNPSLRLMNRNCERYHPNGRKCQGTLRSHTEEGFSFATCSLCLRPFERNDTELSVPRSNKRQRI